MDVFVHNAQLFADNEDGNNYFTDGNNYKHGCNYNNKFTKRQMIQIILMHEKNKKKMTKKKKKISSSMVDRWGGYEFVM